MCLSDLGPIRALVGKMAKFLASEALELAEVSRLPMAIIGVCFAIGRVVVFFMREDDGAGGCM